MANNKRDRRGGFYFVGNKPYVTVTTVLKAIPKPELLFWACGLVYDELVVNPALERTEAISLPRAAATKAMQRGITIHDIVEAHKNNAPRITTIPAFQGYVNAFYQWVNDFGGTVLDNERTVFSHEHRYAGTLDMLVEKNGETFIVDVKTNKEGRIYPENSLQLSAYINALREEGRTDIQRGFVLALSETGNYTYAEIEYCFQTFLNVKEVWQWLNKERCQRYGYI